LSATDIMPPDQIMESCRLVRLQSDGQPVVDLSGTPTPGVIDGIEIPQPVPELYREIMTQRINWIDPSLRCAVVQPRQVPLRLRISYLALKDKSGDIWLDLATLLLEEGAARVASGTFSGREEFLAAEAKARARKAGIWGDERP